MKKTDLRSKYVPFTLATALSTAAIFVIVAACTDNQAKAKPNIIMKDAPKAGIVGKIGGKDITEEELVGSDKMDFFEIEKRKYELSLDKFNRLMVEMLIGEEAKKEKMSTEEFITKKVVKGEPKPSEAELKKFIKDKNIPESQINPQIKERIIAYLGTQKKQDLIQAHIAKLTKNNPAEFYLKKPRMNLNVEVGNAPTFGKEGAPVTIVEFSDFQCPFCTRAANTVTEIKKKYGNKVRVAFRHFPLPMHKEAKPASEASMCINEQSSDKFWKYHDLLFKHQDKLDPASLEKYAKDVGADTKKFAECVAAGKYKDAVAKDQEYGEKIGVKSTPTFFVNGQLIAGAVPIEQFSEIIDEEIANKK